MAAQSKFSEYLSLLWLNLVVKKRNFFEYCEVIWKYYRNFQFLKIDLYLLSLYFFKSPFEISKAYLMKEGAEDIYAYGETPLTTLEIIVKECGLSTIDTLFELGSGRGRGCFWLHTFLECKVTGIEIIPEFVEKANQVKSHWNLDKINFIQGDILEGDYREATVLYLYGTCYDEPFIKKLIKTFEPLRPGTKIITISYPLNDYLEENRFEIMKRFSAPFTWGIGDIYLQVVRGCSQSPIG